MKYLLLTFSLFFILNVQSQSHVFDITKQIMFIGGELKRVDEEGLNPKLKVSNLSPGKYYVGLKDGTTGYYIGVDLKYSHVEQGAYVYLVESYDHEFRNVSLLATETKLSEMANGKKANFMFRFKQDDYWYISTE